MENKLCPHCNITKNVENFYLNNGKHSSWCKPCTISQSKKNAKKNPEKRKEQDKKYYLKKAFNLSVNEYDALLEKQNGVCAICKKVEIRKNSRLSVDHCHNSNIIRGLLCRTCNLGLGYFYDDTNLLNNAISYLQKNLNSQG
jgi:hypothetical protein